ncbi:MAG: NAD(P)/FAD-dependent oxidoreductase [Ferruginibacter sp.]
MNNKRLIVIGGGAAGFFCAINAAKLYPQLRVTIVEKSSKLLSKVKVSGGGRCNVTHACYSIAEMIKKYPRGANFLKKAFHHFFTTDTISWFAERGVKLKTEADGRMFPESNESQTIIDCLLREANKYKVEIMMNAEVEGIVNRESSIGNRQSGIGDRELEKLTGSFESQQRFELHLNNNRVMDADYLCIASGGYPKATQFEWLTRLGHTIEEPVPSLFTFNMPGNSITELMGVAVENVLVKIIGTKLQQTGPLLITHWGMSGPAVLKLSAWGARELAAQKYEYAIVVNWLMEYNENNLKEKMQKVRFDIAPQKIYNRNPFGLPARLWEHFLQLCGIAEDIRWADLPGKEQNKLIKILCAQEFTVKGKTTFKEEFVTAGGVNLEEIDVNTMQSKILPGLFFAGEIINVDGVTGGFNFQNAWTTGWIAANGIGKNL